MSIISFQNEKSVEIDAETSILQSALRNGIPLIHACGGNARCSTCRVLVLQGLENLCPRNQQEQNLSEQRNFNARVRLACQATVKGDVTVRRLVLDEEDKQLVMAEMSSDSPRNVGEEQHLAVLFCDIRNFTTFSESALPYDVVHILNRYFYKVGQVIERHNGKIDNFMGDGMMALFGGKNAENAVLDGIRAGLGMLAAVADMRTYMASQFRLDLQIGIGLHYGQVVFGSVGTGERRRLTAVGDAVNFASRIEEANRVAGTDF
jgi:adenylate cyclase